LLCIKKNIADKHIRIPAVDRRNRRKTVSPKTKINTAIIKLVIIKMLGIRLDFRMKPRSAKLNALRAEDRIINAAAAELSIFQLELIY
jgi:hypothetical protein